MTGFIKILIVFLILTAVYLSGQSQPGESVLATGKWFRATVLEEGIYRIDYSRLQQMGLDDPSHPHVYTGNNGQLSYYNDGTATDDLKEVAVYMSGNDDVLGPGEYILFYGRPSSRWIYDYGSGDYSYLKHNYSDTAFYFITSGPSPAKIIRAAAGPPGSPDYTGNASDLLFRYEKDKDNLIKSGREWFERVSDMTIDPGFPEIDNTEGIRYRLRVAARSSSASFFRLSESSGATRTVQVRPVNLYDFTGTYAETADSSGLLAGVPASPVFRVVFDNNGVAGAYGWLDFLELKARSSNVFSGESLFLSDSKAVVRGGVAETRISVTTSDPVVWDVTDQYNVRGKPFTRNGNEIRFSFGGDSLRHFAVFSPGRALNPLIRSGAVINQNLHGSGPADILIVSHSLFLPYAEELAGIHQRDDGLTSLIVTPEQIYNEFSGGTPDICAIRNFIRFKYLSQQGSGHPLKYLLLFGDGSYENRTPPPSNPNYIPTYQSQVSNIVISSFTSDDFYGLLEDGEGEASGTEDIGIGRLPVTDTLQARTIIDKIKDYTDPSSHGDWRNIICLTADDEDGNTHMHDAEGLADLLQDSVPFINTKKIYLDSYKQETSANGQSYPDAARAINDRINNGCLIFNYVGHGNENGLAHERITSRDDIGSWRNAGRLPLFITATCEFSRFDDMEKNAVSGEMAGKTSAGELVLLNPRGGGIALMSTTRLVYSAPNYTLNRNILDCAFDRGPAREPPRLGDIIRTAKNKTGDGPNKRNFTLLGDPVLRLAWPWHGKIVTDSVKIAGTGEITDTIKALSTVTVSGHLEDSDGVRLAGFNGPVSQLVFDKAAPTRTLANDGGEIMEYNRQENILFSGKTNAENGTFRFTFMVPRDMDYSYGNGRISYYADNDTSDLTGSYTDFTVGGFSDLPVVDTTGPEIKLYLNDTLFRNGGITDDYPVLLAIIEDSGGINTTGVAIGHDLEGYLDDDRYEAYILNGYFENDFDSYTRGRVSYQLGPLAEGGHSATLRAWDNFNNSSESRLVFTVKQNGVFILQDLINYPNPFTDRTSMTAGHNRPDTEMEVTVMIYGMDGRVMKIIRTKCISPGYVLPPLEWDGRTDGGQRAGRGIYPYTVTVSTGEGETARASGRMIIL